MVLFLLACLVSFLPFIALYLWFRNHIKREASYQKLCDKALLWGYSNENLCRKCSEPLY